MSKGGDKDYRSIFVAKCRELGIGDVTIGHRPVSREPLSKEEWKQLYFALLAFQYQCKLIVAEARTQDEINPGRSAGAEP